MKKSGVLALLVMLVGVVIVFTSCDRTTSTEFQESFQKVKEVTPIAGAQNVKMDLQRGEDQDSYFTVTLNDGTTKEGWCIEWGEPASFGINEGTKLYSTKGHDDWKELNYFMSIKDDLRAEDPDLTFKEIQVVIWSLIDNPSFDVDKISTYENISERIYKDGEPLFDVQKVKEIVAQVNTHFASSKSKTNHPIPGVTFVENEGQTIMVGSETAFAVKTNSDDSIDGTISTCFDSVNKFSGVNVTFARWGWTNGPLEDGNYQFDMYAGAGQCDITKGTLVGILTVDYDENAGTANVKFQMTETSAFTGNLYRLLTTHLYVGNEPLPRKKNDSFTVAPGQYPYQNDLYYETEDSYTITGLSGEIFVIAHADVSGFDPDSVDD